MPIAGGEVAVPVLRELTAQWAPHVYAVAIERVHSMPGQGVSSSFKFGQSYGTVRGFFGASFQVIHAQPSVWKGHFTLNGKDKDVARARAIERWPAMAHMLARKKDIGRADAALIGLWSAETMPSAAAPVLTLHIP